jgi:hypothetical protein
VRVSCTSRAQSHASSAAATSASCASSLIVAAPSLCARVPAEVRSRFADGSTLRTLRRVRELHAPRAGC